MITSSTPVLEIVAFTVHAPDAFPELQRRAHEALATLGGHQAGLRLRGLTEGLFADVVAWDSLEAAQRAAHIVREDPRFAPLLASLAELRLLAHYRLEAEPAPLLAELRRAPVVELAAYAVRQVAAHLEVHGRVHQALRAMAGHRGGAPAHQLEDAEQFADLIGWGDAEAHRRAGAALQQRPELAAFFSGIAEMKMFELFSVLG